jgi:hypothetical protein
LQPAQQNQIVCPPRVLANSDTAGSTFMPQTGSIAAGAFSGAPALL